MLITDDDIDYITAKVELLVGCYPQIQWDINMTASAWLISLTEIKATKEEIENAVKEVIKDGYETWQVNIALIINLIKKNREQKKFKTISQNYTQMVAQKNEEVIQEFGNKEKKLEYFKKVRSEYEKKI